MAGSAGAEDGRVRWPALLLLTAVPGLAHDVPDEARIQAFIKPEATRPEATRLRIFVRVPLDSMIDILFPTQEPTPFLDLERTERSAANGAETWVADLLQIYEGATLLPRPRIIATRLSRKSDPAIASYYPNYNAAVAASTGPKLAGNPLLVQGRLALDVLLETPIQSEKSQFRLHPRFGRLGVRVFTTLTFLPPDGGARKFEYEGDPDDFWLNPSMAQSLRRFSTTGSRIAFGWFDLLLFALCATVVARQVRRPEIFAVVFLIVQLGASSWAAMTADLPSAAAAGVLTAAAVVYMGIESIVGATGVVTLVLAGAASGAVFGLAGGFQVNPLLQFGGAHPLASVLAFNSGVVAAEAVLTLVLLFAVGFFLKLVAQPRVAAIILTAIAIHISWLNLIERARLLSRLRL
jgi:hypothetical protein